MDALFLFMKVLASFLLAFVFIKDMDDDSH